MGQVGFGVALQNFRESMNCENWHKAGFSFEYLELDNKKSGTNSNEDETNTPNANHPFCS
jgi:hypothetical protein